jgi:hypothetical protein
MKRWVWPLVLVAAAGLIAAQVYNDASFQRLISPPRSPVARPSASPSPLGLPSGVQADFCATQRYGCRSIAVLGHAALVSYFNGAAIVPARVYAILQEQDRPDEGRMTFAWLIYVDPTTGAFLGAE